MKALLLLVVILAGVWLWRNRAAPLAPPTKPSSPPDANTPQEMVMCTHCGMHIPGNEVVTGKQGVYCSQDHLHLSET